MIDNLFDFLNKEPETKKEIIQQNVIVISIFAVLLITICFASTFIGA